MLTKARCEIKITPNIPNIITSPRINNPSDVWILLAMIFTSFGIKIIYRAKNGVRLDLNLTNNYDQLFFISLRTKGKFLIDQFFQSLILHVYL